MRRLITLASLLAVSLHGQIMQQSQAGLKAPVGGGGGGGTPTFVQGRICEIQTTGTNTTCAYSANVTANNLLVVVARWDEGSPGNPFTPTFTSSAGVSCTWSTALAKYLSGGNNQGVQIMYCIAPSSGAETVQMALSGTNSNFKDLSILEYSGVATTLPLDQVSHTAGPTGSSPTTAATSGTTATLSASGELAIGVCGTWDTSVATWPTVANYTKRATATNTVWAIYDSVTASTSGAVLAMTLPAADQWTSAIVTFKHQ